MVKLRIRSLSVNRILFCAIIFTGILCGYSIHAQAQVFANSYLEFEKPTNWTCDYGPIGFLCKSKLKDDKYEAYILIQAGKKLNGKNSFENYLDLILKEDQEQSNDKNLLKKLIYQKKKRIFGAEWLDSEYYESARADRFTRYLIKAQDELIVVVKVFIPSKSKKQIEKALEPTINSIRTFRRPAHFPCWDNSQEKLIQFF